MSRMHLRAETTKPKDQRVLRFFAYLDTDSNDRIDPKEWSQISSLLGEGLGTGFLQLDADFSGYLTVEELQPLKPLFENLEASKPSVNHLRPLPEATRSVDLNDDGLLAQSELRRALARIHPSLVQHTALIFENADQNSDGRLDAVEIKRALALGTGARKARKLRLR